MRKTCLLLLLIVAFKVLPSATAAPVSNSDSSSESESGKELQESQEPLVLTPQPQLEPKPKVPDNSPQPQPQSPTPNSDSNPNSQSPLQPKSSQSPNPTTQSTQAPGSSTQSTAQPESSQDPSPQSTPTQTQLPVVSQSQPQPLPAIVIQQIEELRKELESYHLEVIDKPKNRQELETNKYAKQIADSLKALDSMIKHQTLNITITLDSVKDLQELSLSAKFYLYGKVHFDREIQKKIQDIGKLIDTVEVPQDTKNQLIEQSEKLTAALKTEDNLGKLEALARYAEFWKEFAPTAKTTTSTSSSNSDYSTHPTLPTNPNGTSDPCVGLLCKPKLIWNTIFDGGKHIINRILLPLFY